MAQNLKFPNYFVYASILAYFARHFIVIIEFFYIDYTTNLLKILLFKKEKPFSKRPKGGKCLGSPCQTERFSNFLYE